MNRLIVSTLALITGFFTLVFALVMAIPLTIVALITGKRLQKQMQNQMNAHQFSAATAQPQYANANTIDGEYEEVNRKA
ncbi:hypothetical protein [Vibrio sp. 10N.261.55.A7]|uniref:hypothetical protein n=1 Tax=Vibrio sp. 10N.261.55.A7 TaxID=1880851 RepID=UPI000C825638|nr:hypothetical protein [Vibrio sp. 10N.261.55.A7]PMJ99963.1 hypothetical protein BCU12_20550 [Vibrio sp. 10N.261.55.A7]